VNRKNKKIAEKVLKDRTELNANEVVFLNNLSFQLTDAQLPFLGCGRAYAETLLMLYLCPATMVLMNYSLRDPLPPKRLFGDKNLEKWRGSLSDVHDGLNLSLNAFKWL
jgi:hypothetical protein